MSVEPEGQDIGGWKVEFVGAFDENGTKEPVLFVHLTQRTPNIGVTLAISQQEWETIDAEFKKAIKNADKNLAEQQEALRAMIEKELK